MYLKVKHEISVTEITFLLNYQVVCKYRYLFFEPLDYISAILFIIVWQVPVVNTLH